MKLIISRLGEQVVIFYGTWALKTRQTQKYLVVIGYQNKISVICTP